MASTIEFISSEEDYGVIPEPYPARKLIPDWYKKLDNKLHQGFGSRIDYEWKFYKEMIGQHSVEQLSKTVKHPSHPTPPLKFLNYWQIKVKKGWSVYFVPPFNRVDKRFECISGLVDCDKYNEYINFPFIWKQPNFDGILEAGTPLVQVIPVPRKVLHKDFKCRSQTKKEVEELHMTRRKRASHESLYRDKLWVRK